MRLEELLEQNQKTITETTSLLKRFHELSVSIGEKQQRQLDAVIAWQATAERQLDAIVGWQAAAKGTLQRLAESHVQLAESYAATDPWLHALADLLEKFLRGSHGDGHTTP